MENADEPEVVIANEIPIKAEGEFIVGDTLESTDDYFPGAKPTTGEISGFIRPDTDKDSNIMESYVSDLPNEGLWPPYCDPAYIMPKEIEVCVTISGGDYIFPVGIEKMISVKPYFGGYRNKMNGRIYHHANSQTPTDRKHTTKDNSNLRARETQTFETRTLSIQSYRESGTQMERIDLRLDEKSDNIIISKKYFTSEQMGALKQLKTVVLQRCWRGYMARCRSYRIRQRNIDFEKNVKEELELKMKIDRDKRTADMDRRLHPKSNSDFATLYNEVDIWRKQEIAKIKSSTSLGEERSAALSSLLADETKALQSIQKLKIAAQKNLHSEKTRLMLERMAEPQKWQLSGGEIAQVQTPGTTRAKELLDLYLALGSPNIASDQRLDVLLHVKWTVRQFDSPLTRDIADLVDREADLINRGRSHSSMENLRLRLGNMFLQFLETPEYNPRADDFINVNR